MVTASLYGIQKPVSRYSYKKRGCDKILVAAPYFLMQDSFFTTSSLNGVLLPTPRPQVTIFIKHEKLFFEIVPCGSELNGRLKTS
ncbi:hypothetical protein EID67_01455 [Enterococcus faecium]|nr:hypothetical protein [Enterococcus faecium]